jgi:hypothetical protein
MKPEMLQTVTLITSRRNEYGDILTDGSAGVTLTVRFRQETTQQHSANREEYGSGAMMWANPDAPLVIGSVVKYGTDYYRVKDIIEARDLDSTDIHFLKCTVDRIKDTANVS